jgi:hypothetical protein
MKTWSDWEITRRQVAICGRVVDAGGRPVAAAWVTLVKMPDRMSRQRMGAIEEAGPRWEALDRRLDRTRTGVDGAYWFLDLAPGKYTLQAAALGTGLIDEQRITLHMDKEQTLQRVTADFRLA